MTDYTQITFFAPKDALASGNPSKLIKGAEVDPELSAISAGIASKYDSTDIADNATAAAAVSDATLMTPLKTKYLLANSTALDLHTNTTIGGVAIVRQTRSIAVSGALTGGGNLTADRTITLDVTGMTALGSGVDGANDLLMIYDTSAAAYKKVTPDTIYSGLSGAVPNSRTLTAGNGLTGGGDLTANRTFDIGAGTGITVNADDVALSAASQASLALANTSVQPARTITAGTGLTGGGDLSANRTISLDYETGTYAGNFNNGFTATQTPTIRYTRIGKMVTLLIPAFFGTSNSTSFFEGSSNMPASCKPARLQAMAAHGIDSASAVTCWVSVDTTGVIIAGKTPGSTNWSSSSSKGLGNGTTPVTVTYSLD